MLAALTRKLHVLQKDDRGFALTEFAFAAPILILMYLGSFQLCNALTAQRKVTTTARAITDLASQYQIVSDADLDAILASSTQILAPYNINSGSAVISQITIDGAGVAKVSWSKGLNTTGRIVGSVVTVPNAIKQANTSLLYSEVRYNYESSGVSPIIGSMNLHDQVYMAPRTVNSIIKV